METENTFSTSKQEDIAAIATFAKETLLGQRNSFGALITDMKQLLLLKQ